jgi:hypothetical protein
MHEGGFASASRIPRARAAPAAGWVALGLVLLTVAATWPLGARLTRSLPGDYGDPVFVSWAMGWVMGQLARGELSGLWDANIFAPERTTLAFSESFLAQSVLALPIHILTGNLILSYNVAFFLSFVLTGLGTFLLARALTGSSAAAIVAAGVATFNEYRLVHEVAHLHTLSIYGLPFALYALHLYFATDRRRALAGAVLALAALGYSSVYGLAYSAPFVLLFALADAVGLRRARTLRVWLELWAAAAAVVVLLILMLLAYMDVHQRLGIARTLPELIAFSVSLDRYWEALPRLAPALALAAAGVIAGLISRTWRGLAALLALLVLLAFWLSLGPVVRAGGEPVGCPGLYGWLHAWIPGFTALRVPARFVAIFFLFVGVLAGVGVAWLEQRRPLAARALAAAALALFIVRAAPDPFPIDRPLPSDGLVTPPPSYLTPSPRLPAIYQAVDTLPSSAVLIELPFGSEWYEVRYMYFAAMHRRRLVNGYSGVYPPSYLARQRVLRDPLRDPVAAARALSPATHVVLHPGAWPDDTGDRVAAWLETLGARRLAEADGALLYERPVREQFAHERTTEKAIAPQK